MNKKDKKKKKRKSPKKGGNYERDICKKLSLWFSKVYMPIARDDIFWRTSGSGSRATTRMKSNLDTTNSCGDIMALHRIGRKLTRNCIIELKRGYTKTTIEGISILNLLDNKRSKKKPIMIRWLKKEKRQAKRHKKKHQIIIFRRDRKASCIVIMANTYDMLKNNYRPFRMYDGQSCQINAYGFNYYIFRLEDFLYWCPPKAFNEKVQILEPRRYPWKRGKYGIRKMKNFKGLYK